MLTAYIPGTVLSTNLSNPQTALWGRFHYYPSFLVKKLVQDPTLVSGKSRTHTGLKSLSKQNAVSWLRSSRAKFKPSLTLEWERTLYLPTNMLSMALRPAVVWSDAREDGSKEVWGPSRKEHLSCILKVKVSIGWRQAPCNLSFSFLSLFFCNLLF